MDTLLKILKMRLKGCKQSPRIQDLTTRDDFITKGILWVKRQENVNVSKTEIKV